ncbi:MAG: hypothetical protein JJV93_02575 [Alphaproteobacteria bacterium]|nr:hypothetical protein [Alphaproteobacteria bacterium]
MYRILFSLLILVPPVVLGYSAPSAKFLRRDYSLDQKYQYRDNLTSPSVICPQIISDCLSSYCGEISLAQNQPARLCSNMDPITLTKAVKVCLANNSSAQVRASGNIVSTASNCSPYISSSINIYLSSLVAASQLISNRSEDCLNKKEQLNASMACHQTALAFGQESASSLKSRLMLACGPGVRGGTDLMVSKFYEGGNVRSTFGMISKIITLDDSKKGTGWKDAMDEILIGYINQMNLACQTQMSFSPSVGTDYTSESYMSNIIKDTYSANTANTVNTVNTYNTASTFSTTVSSFNVYSAQSLVNYNTARQVVMAGLTNDLYSPNQFLSSKVMGDMQEAVRNNTKVFIIRDALRCYIVPITNLSPTEHQQLLRQEPSCHAM